jgi:nucleotide-binding universal stress UspA family protein
MKVVIGIDSEDLYREAIHLTGRLEFEDCNPVLVHVSDTILMPMMAATVLPPRPEVFRAVRTLAERVLHDAARACDDANLVGPPEIRHREGNSSMEILRVAEEEGAALVAVGSRRQGALGSTLLGSVGRALAIHGERSFLVARSGVTTRGNVRAVFATDHSAYADRCLDDLLRLDPRGLNDLRIVFATEGNPDIVRRAAVGVERQDLSEEDAAAIVKAKGEALVRQCLESGRPAEYRMVDDFAIGALRNAMYETKSDLLIVGARGHGFVERLVIGSLSLHMVVAEPFSVLVVRPSEVEK